MNKLYFGDNLHILREHIPSESVDLIYLDPPAWVGRPRPTSQSKMKEEAIGLGYYNTAAMAPNTRSAAADKS